MGQGAVPRAGCPGLVYNKRTPLQKLSAAPTRPQAPAGSVSPLAPASAHPKSPSLCPLHSALSSLHPSLTYPLFSPLCLFWVSGFGAWGSLTWRGEERQHLPLPPGTGPLRAPQPALASSLGPPACLLQAGLAASLRARSFHIKPSLIRKRCVCWVTSLFVLPETSKPSGDLLGGLDMKNVGDETEREADSRSGR